MYASGAGGNRDRVAGLGPEHLPGRRDELGQDQRGGPRRGGLEVVARGAGFRPVVVGGPEDRGLAQQLVAGGAGASAAGEFSLQETGALLARAAVAVSGDTGVMHMATGVGTPVIALFGPTVEQFGFFPYRASAAVLQQDLGCRPCSATGTATCPLGHHRCLGDITPADVAAAVARLVT